MIPFVVFMLVLISFLLYPGVGQKFKFLFKSLIWYFVNEYLEGFYYITGLSLQRIALEIAFRNSIMFPQFFVIS